MKTAKIPLATDQHHNVPYSRQGSAESRKERPSISGSIPGTHSTTGIIPEEPQQYNTCLIWRTVSNPRGWRPGLLGYPTAWLARAETQQAHTQRKEERGENWKPAHNCAHQIQKPFNACTFAQSTTAHVSVYVRTAEGDVWGRCHNSA